LLKKSLPVCELSLAQRAFGDMTRNVTARDFRPPRKPAFSSVQSLLFGMKPNDPLALTLATAILISAAILAGYLPARRASRIDLMTALRHQ
jgi:ABC-type antimicrobial peptide transport system permease subunit